MTTWPRPWPAACDDCGGGFPGDVPDGQVCTCGTAFARKQPKGLKRSAPMNRGSGLKRTSSLKSGGSLARSTPLPRKRATPRRVVAKVSKPANEIPPAVRAAVLARAGGSCEACGKSLGAGPVHLHHRQKRNGRNHTVENLVALHPLCHVVAPEAVHQRPTWAKSRGLILLAHHDPAAEPLTLPDGARVLLGEIYRLAA